MLTVIPVFFMLGLTFALSGYFIQLKSRVRKTCIEESIEIQKNIIKSEQRLFKMNPLSTTLRIELLAAQADLALQTYMENPVGIAHANYLINSIKSQQESLDLLQKGIIKAAEVYTQIQTQLMLSNLYKHVNEMGLIWKFYLFVTNSIHLSQAPEFAVRPDIEETAPNYELKDDYKSRQQLVLFWHHHYQTSASAEHFIKTETNYEFSCGSGPNYKGGKWSIEIKGDKF